MSSETVDGFPENGQVDESAEPTDDTPAPDLGGSGEVDLGEIDVAAVVAERNEFKDIAMRLQADFDNYRKRVAATQADEIDRATGRLIDALLPVLDACEAAYAHGVDGVSPIWSSLIGTLQKQGLEAFDLVDKPFDPNTSEAVVHEDGDGAEPVVVEVMRTGYQWKGRVLRAALVKVRG